MKLFYKGCSHDGRTNKWGIECVCGKLFEPPTTLLSNHVETCPKCGKQYIVNYNEQKIEFRDKAPWGCVKCGFKYNNPASDICDACETSRK